MTAETKISHEEFVRQVTEITDLIQNSIPPTSEYTRGAVLAALLVSAASFIDMLGKERPAGTTLPAAILDIKAAMMRGIYHVEH